LTGKATDGQYMSFDVADLLSLDGGSVHEHTEFQHFIRSCDVVGTKADNTNGHHCKNATAIHDFTPSVDPTFPDDRLIDKSGRKPTRHPTAFATPAVGG
jgi:hypothetical protein